MTSHHSLPVSAIIKLVSLVVLLISAYFRALFLMAGLILGIMKFLFSMCIKVLRPIYSVVSPIVSPLLAAYLTFITSLNVRAGTFLQALLVHAPWLARLFQPVVKFLAPISFTPAFQVVQSIFMLAVVPYIVAVAVGMAMFLYTFGACLIVNGAKLLCDYLFAYGNGTKVLNRNRQVLHEYPSIVGTLKIVGNKIIDSCTDNYNAWDRRTPRPAVVKFLLISLHCASLLVLLPIAFVNRLITFGIKGAYGIIDAFFSACAAGKDAANATLNIQLFRIMRRPWTTLDNMPLEPVNNSAHELERGVVNSSQASDIFQLDIAEITTDDVRMLNAALKADRENKTGWQSNLIGISQQKRKEGTNRYNNW